MPAKRLRIETAVLDALSLLATDERKSLQDLTDEAFADLLKKYRRPVGLRDALRQSLARQPVNANQRRRPT